MVCLAYIGGPAEFKVQCMTQSNDPRPQEGTSRLERLAAHVMGQEGRENEYADSGDSYSDQSKISVHTAPESQ